MLIKVYVLMERRTDIRETVTGRIFEFKVFMRQKSYDIEYRCLFIHLEAFDY